MTLAKDILRHAEAFCGLPEREAHALTRRLLYAEGLPALLRGAPDNLLARVALVKPEAVEVELMRRFRTASKAS